MLYGAKLVYFFLVFKHITIVCYIFSKFIRKYDKNKTHQGNSSCIHFCSWFHFCCCTESSLPIWLDWTGLVRSRWNKNIRKCIIKSMTQNMIQQTVINKLKNILLEYAANINGLWSQLKKYITKTCLEINYNSKLQNWLQSHKSAKI
jgi:hypothetical protein